MSFTWNPRLVKTPTPIMSAMTIAVAVAVDTVARFELPLLAGVIGYFPNARGRNSRPTWKFPSEGTVGNSNGRLRANSGRQPRGKVTILRKKFSPPGRRTVGALALEVRPVTTRALFGLSKLGFNLGNPRF